MKKFIAGTLFGFLIAFGVGAYAEETTTLVGSVVQGTFPVSVDGEKLANQAIVVDNSTYLPVRDFGEAIGYDVNFDAEMGVKMTKSAAEIAEKKRVRKEKWKADDIAILQERINTKKSEVESIKRDLKYFILGKDDYKKEFPNTDADAVQKEKEAAVTKAEAELQQLEDELAKLQ